MERGEWLVGWYFCQSVVPAVQSQPSSDSEPPGPDFLQGLTQAAVPPCFLSSQTADFSPMVRVTALLSGHIIPALHQAHPEGVIVPATNLESADFGCRGSVSSSLLKQRVVGLEGRLSQAELQ